MTDRSVMLAFPHTGTVRAEFMLSVLEACRGDTPVSAIADVATGPLLAKARAELAARFLASDAEWLFTVDSDMMFGRETIPALLAWADPDERPVIAGLCYTVDEEGRIIAVAYRAGKDEQGFAFTSLPGEDIPPDDLLLADATGAACMLIHRSVFGKLTAAEGRPGLWYAEQVIDGRIFGEDLSFCLRLKAAGIPLYIATGVQLGHVKTVQVGQVSP